MLAGLPLYAISGGAVLVDPATLPLRQWVRNYGGAPWLSMASAGASGDGSHDFVTDGSDPTITTLDGHGVAACNGSHYLQAEGTLGSYVGTASFSFWALLRPDTVDGACGVWGDASAGILALSIVDGDVVLSINGGDDSVSRAISPTTWSLVTGRWNGSTLQVGVNEVPGAAGGDSTVGYNTPLTDTSNNVYIGRGIVGWYIGLIADWAITNVALTDQQFLDVIAYAKARYPSAGLP